MLRGSVTLPAFFLLVLHLHREADVLAAYYSV